MGMFDTVYYKGHEFQCKDTPAQIMENYAITKEGELYHEKKEYNWVSDDEMLLGGYLESESLGWEQVTDFDGSLVLTAIEDGVDDLLLLFWGGIRIREKTIDWFT